MTTNSLPAADATTLAAVRAVIEQYCEGARGRARARARDVPSGGADERLPAGPADGRHAEAVLRCDPERAGAREVREPYRYEIVRVEAAGPIASVTLVEGPYLGMQFTEFFHLVQLDGRWRIVSKTFTHT